MSGGACKTVICATGRVSSMGESKLRRVFANPVIAEAVGENLVDQNEIWRTLEKDDLERKDKEFLRDCLKQFIE